MVKKVTFYSMQALFISMLMVPFAWGLAYSNNTTEIPFSRGSIKVDAVLDEPLWKEASVVKLKYQTYPGNNILATVETEVLLVENGNELLVGFLAYDPQPHKIRAFLRDRDSALSDDFVGIVLDTFNDQKRAFKFFVNALGSQVDSIQDDVAGGDDDSWNATWEAKGRITDEGYVVEMAIPLNILRFRSGLTRQNWGLDLLRYRPRDDQHMHFDRLERDISCYLCQLGKAVGFATAKPGRNLEIVPSFVSIAGENRDLQANQEWQDNDATDLGLDFRWGITPSTTINTTINPDFSQVEADAVQLGVNTKFSLFFPERRPFFLDSADYFQTLINVVHTRNIAAPDYGVKFTNKSGGNTTGIIVANDEQTTFVAPRFDGSDIVTLDQKSQNAVFRYRRDFGGDSALGAIVTARQADGYENLLYGIDGKYRLTSTDNIDFQVLRSTTVDPDEVVAQKVDSTGRTLAKDQSDTAFNVRYDHIGANWLWYTEFQEFGQDFRSDLGFVTQVDFDNTLAGIGHVWFGNNQKWWNRLQFEGSYEISHRGDGQVLDETYKGIFKLNGPLLSFSELELLARERFFEGVTYDQDLISWQGDIKPASGLHLGFRAVVGDAIDFDNNRAADTLELEPSFSWNIGRSLQVRFKVRYQELVVAAGKLLDASAADLRVTYQFSNRSRLRLTMQQTEVNRELELYDEPGNFDRYTRFMNRQLLYSYIFTPQTVFFLGYSDGERYDENLEKFEKDNRSIFLKLSYAWRPN